MSRIRSLLGGAAIAGAGLAWYGYRYGLRDFRLNYQQIPGVGMNLSILHISDLHLGPHNRALSKWLPQLAQLQPDLVAVTGDSLAGRHSIGAVLDALEPLFDFPGVMVGGSHDYYEPRIVNPFKYLKEPSQKTKDIPETPWRNLQTAVRLAGWYWPENAAVEIETKAGPVNVIGIDDAHYDKDDLLAATKSLESLEAQGVSPKDERVTGGTGNAEPSRRLTLGVTHAPYVRVLDGLFAAGADVVLAGHTHGGQIRLPKVGSLVTNCDLPNKHSKGLTRFGSSNGAELPGGVGSTGGWLHVSAGLGTSPFAPFRLGCPPEATLLELTH